MSVLKMGTRGSPLALAQSGEMARALERMHPGLQVETVVVKTSGDEFGAPPPAAAKALPQGAKGLWVEEIEQALLDGAIDFAVHSAKDLPAALAAGLEIAAFPERADARDALVARPGYSWNELGPGARVGTSSLRRRLLLTAAKPGVEVVELRGNVDTRLRKLEALEFDAMILAVAGIRRLGRTDVELEPLEPGIMLPAPGQGALALEIRAGDAETASLVGLLDDAPTRSCVEFERGFLAAVGGGCGSPVGAHASLVADGLRLEGFYALEGESAGRRVSGICADPSSRDAFVADLAAQASAR